MEAGSIRWSPETDESRSGPSGHQVQQQSRNAAPQRELDERSHQAQQRQAQFAGTAIIVNRVRLLRCWRVRGANVRVIGVVRVYREGERCCRVRAVGALV